MRAVHKIVGILLVAIPLGAAAQTAYTTRAVNLRAGPDSTYPLVASLAPGTAVSVAGCLESYTWCDVYVGDLRGFVYATYLNYPYQSNRVPIYSYGPALGLPLITFSLGNYWDNYYRGRPFYNRRSYWEARPYHAPPPRFGNSWRPPVYRGGNDHRPDYRPPRDNRPAQGSYRPPQSRPSHDNGNRPQGRPSQDNGNRPQANRPQGNRGGESYTTKPKNANGGEAGG
ncbi:MAG: SH3 domain-containing protein [Betaproteobacteria bacterium]